MNKFSHVAHGSLLKEFSYLKQLQSAKNRLEKEVKSEFRVNSEAIESGVLSESKRFRLHQSRVFSDSETSANSSPRRSVDFSGIDLELHHLLYEENKLHIKNERKKLHKHSNQNINTINNNDEIDIDDPYLISKKEKENHVKYETDMSPSRKETSPKPASRISQKNLVNNAVFEKKFKLLVEKSLHTITDISSILEKGIDPPDGDEDTSRRLLRVKEFSNRFSRNYLYPIARQLEDLGKWKSTSIASTYQKLVSSYQVILNGLQAYHNHLPTSISGYSSDKLKCLLKQLLELCELHRKLLKLSVEDKCNNIINAFQINAELVLRKVEDSLVTKSTDTVLKSNATKVSLLQKKPPVKTKSKSNITERLSMYAKTSAFRKDPMWKKTTETLSQKKMVQSRYKTAIYRHRPPVEKMPIPIPILPMKCKLFPKKSGMFQKTPVNSPINEDNIQTMVETANKGIESDKDVDENKNELEPNHEELLVKLLQLVLKNKRHNADGQGHDNDTNTNTAAYDEINDILEKLKNTLGCDALQKIIEGLKKNEGKENTEQLELKICDENDGAVEQVVMKKKEPTMISITGPKNAKLICIKDDNSTIEDNEDIDKKEDKCQPIKAVTSQTQTLLTTENKSTQRPATKTNMKKIGKSSKVVEMLPKHYAVNIIQYKLDFHKYCKNNSMYRRTTNILPWILTGKISDELIDLVLLGVAREIEVNDIAERIFQSELQL